MTEALLKVLWKGWATSAGISEEDFDKWAADTDRAWHCVFCGEHGSLEEDFTTEADLPDPGDPENYRVSRLVTNCPKCREHKGIEPCVNNHCPWGEE